MQRRADGGSEPAGQHTHATEGEEAARDLSRRLAEAADELRNAERRADAGEVEQRGGDEEAQRIFEAHRIGRHLGAMRMAVEYGDTSKLLRYEDDDDL